MDLLKKFFPLSFRAKKEDVPSFVIALILYAVLLVVGGFVIGLLSHLPLLGILFALLGSLFDLYGLCGVALTILYFVGVLKD